MLSKCCKLVRPRVVTTKEEENFRIRLCYSDNFIHTLYYVVPNIMKLFKPEKIMYMIILDILIKTLFGTGILLTNQIS